MTSNEELAVAPSDRAENALAEISGWVSAHRPLAELVASEFESTLLWPTVDAVQRTLAKRGVDEDVRVAIAQMPRLLGERDSKDRVQLRVAGLAQVASGRSTADGVARLARLATDRYLNGDGDPRVTHADISTLHLTGSAAIKVATVALDEPGLWGGGTGPDGGTVSSPWERTVTYDTHRRYREVATLDDFIHVHAEWFGPTLISHPAAPIVRSSAASNMGLSLDVLGGVGRPAKTVAGLGVADLHQAIAEGCESRFDSGHYRDGVREAAMALRDLIRAKAGVRKQMRDEDLINQALGGATPMLHVADHRTETGRNIQRGCHSIAVGVQAAFRNPLSHEAAEITEIDALEMVAAMSWVARRVDDAKRKRVTRTRRPSKVGVMVVASSEAPGGRTRPGSTTPALVPAASGQSIDVAVACRLVRSRVYLSVQNRGPMLARFEARLLKATGLDTELPWPWMLAWLEQGAGARDLPPGQEELVDLVRVDFPQTIATQPTTADPIPRVVFEPHDRRPAGALLGSLSKAANRRRSGLFTVVVRVTADAYVGDSTVTVEIGVSLDRTLTARIR